MLEIVTSLMHRPTGRLDFNLKLGNDLFPYTSYPPPQFIHELKLKKLKDIDSLGWMV
jgi:hypothetical protein